MTGRVWNAAELETLHDMVAAGRSIPEIAAAVGRSENATHVRMHRLGLRLHPLPTQRQLDRLADLVERGFSKSVAVRLTGLSRKKVDNHIRRLGLVGPRSEAFDDVRPYDERLIQLSTAGLRTAEIASQVGLATTTVRSRLLTLARREAIAEMRGAA
ncbi:hypothetical protein [Antarcticirhabdus aurantiaca]|uniref:hypothetical protein n=1 Tax=Antarcticirhabdus aurantiaca TaxID=2606717 RepID=UPI00131BE3E7|nr:hypothetical protein [Antarcticirhabdus aurantiaca]